MSEIHGFYDAVTGIISALAVLGVSVAGILKAWASVKEVGMKETALRGARFARWLGRKQT